MLRFVAVPFGQRKTTKYRILSKSYTTKRFVAGREIEDFCDMLAEKASDQMRTHTA
jgi:hypothetical protein